MSAFQDTITAACQKKEKLFDESLPRYALRSMLAGGYLTASTACGAIAADIITPLSPALSRFVFAFIFAFGLLYVVFLNSELATSNMMFLTAGAYYRAIRWRKAVAILLFCTVFNFVGATILAYLFDQSFSFSQLTNQSFLVNAVQTKLAKSDWQNLIEGVTANIFVNIAIFCFLFIKDQSAKIPLILSAIFMFVFLVNEHLIANFASFMLAAFSQVENIQGLNIITVLRQWVVVFVGNWIGGGLFIGLAYAWLNKTKTPYQD